VFWESWINHVIKNYLHFNQNGAADSGLTNQARWLTFGLCFFGSRFWLNSGEFLAASLQSNPGAGFNFATPEVQACAQNLALISV
jgi:hypothetical protein